VTRVAPNRRAGIVAGVHARGADPAVTPGPSELVSGFYLEGGSEYGRLVEIPLPAGTYELRATFLDALINGVHPIESSSVKIPPGDTVRLSFVLQIA